MKTEAIECVDLWKVGLKRAADVRARRMHRHHEVPEPHAPIGSMRTQVAVATHGGVREGHALESLVRPRCVAIVGASADVRRTAGKPALYLTKHGFGGRVYLVNPRYPEINGLACVPRVADLPEAPDVGLVLLGAEPAITAVRELAERGAKAAIVLAGGPPPRCAKRRWHPTGR
jgi:predicted CoA-binding protein